MATDDTKTHAAAGCPPGCAIIERVGWEDGRLTATLIFPKGMPDLPLRVVWRMTPVRLVVVEESDNA